MLQPVDAELLALARSAPACRCRPAPGTARNRPAWRDPRRTGSRPAARRRRNRRCNPAAGSRARRASSRTGRGPRRPRACRATAASVSSAGRHSLRSDIARPSTASASASSACVAGALIGDVGRGRGALEQEGLFAGTGGADLEDGFGEPQPVGAVFGRGGGDLPEDLQADAEVGAPESGVGVGAQRRGGFGDRPRLALDLGLQLDGRIGQIVALEGLVRGAAPPSGQAPAWRKSLWREPNRS